MPFPLIAAAAVGGSALLQFWHSDADDSTAAAAAADADGCELADASSLQQSATASTTIAVTLTRRGTLGYGIVLDHKGEPPDKVMWVDGLVDGLAAVQCGLLRVGDLLIEVAGCDTKYMSIDEVAALLAEHRSVALVFMRRRKAEAVQAVLDASETNGAVVDNRETLYDGAGAKPTPPPDL